MGVADEIRGRLQAAFAPVRLEVADVSEAHRGHVGFSEGGESHFEIAISAAAFDGMSRLERHRAIHAALGRDLVTRVHAIGLDVSGTGEA